MPLDATLLLPAALGAQVWVARSMFWVVRRRSGVSFEGATLATERGLGPPDSTDWLFWGKPSGL